MTEALIDLLRARFGAAPEVPAEAAASATLACRTEPAPSSPEVGDALPAPTAPPTVDVLVGDAARYARERLGMAEPRLSFGLTGTRAPRGSVVSVAPARCTPGALLATARARGLSWEKASDLYVSYGPRERGGAIWTVGRKDAPMLTSTDDECVATAAGQR